MAVQIKSIEALKSNRLFYDIDQKDISFPFYQRDVVTLPEGSIIFQSGDQVDHIYLILEGEVKIKHNIAIDGQRIFEKGRDDFFGEQEFLSGTNRLSSAVANSETTVYILRRRELNELVKKDRHVLNNLRGMDPTRLSTQEFRNAKSHSETSADKLYTREITHPEDGTPIHSMTEDDGFVAFKHTHEIEPTFGNAETNWNFDPDHFILDLEHEPPHPVSVTPGSKGPAITSVAAPDDENFPIPEQFNFQTVVKDTPVNSAQHSSPVDESEEELSWDFSAPIADDEEHHHLYEDPEPREQFFKPEPFKDDGVVDDPPPSQVLNADPRMHFNFGDDIDSEVKWDFNENAEPIAPPMQDNDWGKFSYNEPANEEPFEPISFPEPEAPVQQPAPVYAEDVRSQEKPRLTTAQLKMLIKAAQLVNSNIKIDDVLNSIVTAASSLTQADRGTLYIVDAAHQQLWSKVLKGENIEEIRLKIGQGLAGYVAQTGEILNIEDAQNDPRFDANIDKATGYKTRTMLCYPIRDREGAVTAVLQLLNKKEGVFNELDEEFLEALSVHIALALSNAELVDQILVTDRMTSLGKVAKFLISDIKNPILAIRNLADQLQKKSVSDEHKRFLNMIKDQSTIVADLVMTTLGYTEGKTILNKKVQHINQVLEDIVEKLSEYFAGRNITVYKKFEADIFVNLDKKEFFQACFQIIKNAAEAMPGGGKFYISTAFGEVQDTVLISFKDTGSGFPETIKERIFEPFMSQGKKHGVGLGLAIAEKIVKDHGGSITAESDLGEGATFFITLPSES